MTQKKIIPVILCGGSGTRLWPMSREAYPKQFLTLSGETSLLQETVVRSLRLSGAQAGDVVIVTLQSFSDDVARQVEEVAPGASAHMICEPLARNTAAAVAYAAAYVARVFGEEAVMWVLPSDHHIGLEAPLGEAFELAVRAAVQDRLVTFGIRPTRPDTGYGYIRLPSKIVMDNSMPVAAFVEKPDLTTAQGYVDSGAYLWNSGMFVFTAGFVLRQFDAYAADIMEAVRQALQGPDQARPAAELYARIPLNSFDKAIMEKSPAVDVVPCDPDWSDIGSWQSLWEIASKDGQGNLIKGSVVETGTRNCFIQGQEGRVIACAGVENLVVVDTGDAILVADLRNTDSLRSLVARLKDSGHEAILRTLPLSK